MQSAGAELSKPIINKAPRSSESFSPADQLAELLQYFDEFNKAENDEDKKSVIKKIIMRLTLAGTKADVNKKLEDGSYGVEHATTSKEIDYSTIEEAHSILRGLITSGDPKSKINQSLRILDREVTLYTVQDFNPSSM